MTYSIDQAVIDFIAYGIEASYIHPLDRLLKQNQLLALLKLDALDEDLSPSKPLPKAKDLLPIFTGGIESATEQAVLSAQIMAVMTPDSSVLNDRFWQKYAEDPILATDYFFELSKSNDYIQTKAIAKNIAFDYQSHFGKLGITINLSKPEKDPKTIAAAKTATTINYPKCQLCMENEGYAGHLQHPARANHRIVRFPLKGETWGLQYSPYAYYNEHCIFLAEEHRPMEINGKTFENLLAIVEQFPHYFVGSNADLPIVGGSILTHDHYQGGRYRFPMDDAPVIEHFSLDEFPDVTSSIVKWPLSVVRLEGSNQASLQKAAELVLEKWRAYSDSTADILAFSDETPHNTITPIARRNGDNYILDLVLRNNRTSAEFPDGIFHPHPDVQHIKKENIGLIEVMGLAILPPRLKEELEEVREFLAGERDSVNPIHSEWAEKLKQKDEPVSVEDEVGSIFQRVLEDAGVFKMNDDGLAAFKRFVDVL